MARPAVKSAAMLLAAAALVASFLLARSGCGRAGRAPGEGRAGPSAIAPGGDQPKTMIELYFSLPDGSALATERRLVRRDEDTVAQSRAIIEELKRGSEGGLAPLLPVEMEVRAVFLVGKELVIDLQPRVREAAAGTLQEALIWYSVVNSIIMNVKQVSGVRFLVDGLETDAILGHMDMRGAFSERLDLVKWY